MGSIYSQIVQLKAVTQCYQLNLDQLRSPLWSDLLSYSAPSQMNEQQNWTGLYFRKAGSKLHLTW
jgi:hypothetical protein